MQLNRMRLTSRVILLALVAVLPAILIQVYNLVDIRRIRAAEVGEATVRQAQLAGFELDRVFEGVRNLLTAIGQVEAVRSLEVAGCVAYLEALQPEIPHILRISVFDGSGRLRCSSPMPPQSQDVADRRYFSEPRELGRFVVGEYTESGIDGRPFLPLSAPLDAGDEQSGVLMAGLDLAWLSANLKERGLPPGGSVTVADRNGVIIARQPFPERFVGTHIPEAFRGLLTAPEPGSLEVTSQDGVRRMLGYVPIRDPSRDLYVSAGLSAEDAFAGVRAATERFAVLLLLGLAAAVGAALIAGRLVIRRPVNRLLAAGSAWQRGDFSARSGLRRQDGEFGQIGEQMDRVADEVQRREAALRESEERYRALIHASATIEWRADPEGNMQDAPLWASYTGQASPAHHGWNWLEMVHPDDREATARAWKEGHVGNSPVEVDYRVFHAASGLYRWVHESGVPLFNPDGSVREWVGAVTDIHERRQAEDRQRLLLHELNHRVKNTLASVQAIVSQTLRLSPSMEVASERIQARLMALSGTHNLLNATGWSGAGLGEILAAEFEPYRGGNAERVRLEGPPVTLDAKAALALGLIFHELATNAAKYGALSVEKGGVAVSWRAGEAHGAPLAITWRERGGPRVEPPARRGFGSRLIERSVADELNGEVRFDYAPEGFSCAISFPQRPPDAEPAREPT